MTTAAEMQTKVAKLETDMDRLRRIVNGGITDTVETDNGVVPSIANLQQQFVGHSPVLAGVADGSRRVFQVTDWIGANPTSPKPPTGGYVGPTGLVSNIALATNFRGEQGPAGSSGGGSGGLAFDTVVSYGAIGDGVTDCTTAFQNANSDGLIIVPEGVFRINSTLTLTAPIVFMVPFAGRIRPGAGYTLTLDGTVIANAYEHVFDTSEADSKVAGLFGFVPLSPCWWGAVPDGYVDGTGTNNLAAFQKCFLARTVVGAPANLIKIPAGRFFMEGPAAAAISNSGYAPGNGQPENWVESAMLQAYQGTWIVGDGMGPSQIIIGNTSTVRALSLGGRNTSGPPSGIENIIIGTELGGAGIEGICIYANGATVRNVWGSGFPLTFRADSTDQAWANCVSEYAGFASGNAGFYIARGSNTFTQLLACLMSDGFVIDHQDTQSESTFIACRAINPNSVTGRYGFAATGANTKAKFSDCYVEGDTFVVAFNGYACTELQYNGCTARLKGNASAFDMNGVIRVSGSNNRARITGGSTPTSSYGLRNTNCGYCSFDNSHFEGFWQNYKVDTTGVLARLTNSTLINGISRGALISRAAHSIFTSNFVAYNGTTFISADVGVEVSLNGNFQIHTYADNIISNQNNAITDIAMKITIPAAVTTGLLRAYDNTFCYTPSGLVTVPATSPPFTDIRNNSYVTT